MTDLHLVSWNRPKMTELVIKTIHKNTPRDNFRLVVLDNASEPQTVEMLERLHEAGLIDELILIKTNLGLEAARNLLLNEATQGEYFVCVDNDCLPQKGWLDGLLNLMQGQPEYAAISLRTEPMIGTGNIFVEADELGDELVDFPHPGGSFRLMRTGDVLAVGGWDRGAAGRGSEETYICGKLRDEGFKTAFAVKLRCLHLFGTEGTDYWGYDKSFKPEDTGHSPGVWHPKFAQGDVYDEVLEYAKESDVIRYFA